jgi:16S rRNA (uracil1498-N3)-methyltransferase
MNLHRFHVPDLRSQHAANLSDIVFPPEQGHHARAVLRLNPGDAVVLFDGGGAWTMATLTALAKSAVHAAAKEALNVDSPPDLRLTLATAAPKGDRAEWLLEQASQLNAAVVQWLDCERGVVKPREGGGKIDKWRRLAIESAKQCGRTHILEVRELASLQAVLLAAPQKVLWLDPGEGGQRAGEAMAGMRTGSVLALIGPEGGWSDGEHAILNELAKGGRIGRVRLTPTVLRIETACAALAALVMA